MSNAYRTGAAMAQLSVAGLGGLGGTSKKKGKKRRAAPRQSSGLRRVVNAFVAGKMDQDGCKWDVDTGRHSCDYSTDGLALTVHGRQVASRLSGSASGGLARGAKQIRVCAQSAYALDTKDAKERKVNGDLLGAVNAIMDSVKTGVRFRDIKDYDKGFRTVLSQFRLGAGGSAALIPHEVGYSFDKQCVTIELTDEMRSRAIVNLLNEQYSDQLLQLKKDAGLPFTVKKGRPMSKDEVAALLSRLQMTIENAATPAEVDDAFARLRESIKAGRSTISF